MAGDRGSATAEFAVLFPAAVAVMGAALLGVQGQLQQINLAQLAPIAARALAHGKSLEQVQLMLGSPAPALVVAHRDGLLCATLSQRHSLGWLGVSKIEQTACAAEQGL